MIPPSITAQHVLLAIEEIRTGGVPSKREATKFNLVHEGRFYPPKLCLSLAAKHATGYELTPAQFSGGDEANNYLVELGFEIQAKNPDWSWKECYFAVWGYDQLDIDREQVKSILYREIADLIGRTAKSVEYKIQNVSSFDVRPRHEKPLAEAHNAQALLGKVFEWYWSNRTEAREKYNSFAEEFQFNLRSTADINQPIDLGTRIDRNVVIEEGATISAPSTRRKRSQKLLEEGRKHFRGLDAQGKLRCHACGFVSPEGVDTEIIHLHHTNPIYEVEGEGRSITLSDALASLIPLCPTCHSIAHTSKPPLSAESIRKLLAVQLNARLIKEVHESL